MSKSKIEWTDETWNPVTGCSHVSEGCRNCYAEREWPRLAGNKKTVYHGREFTDVQCHDDRLGQPLHWKKPRKIFVNPMSDLFHPDVPFEFIDKVFAVMALADKHTFQILTKRSERMQIYIQEKCDKAPEWVEYPSGLLTHLPYEGGWPKNTWLGVSVEDQKTADERIPFLLKTRAAVRFVSYEPALGPVDLTRLKVDGCAGRNSLTGEFYGVPATGPRHHYKIDVKTERRLNWVIMGGESGPNARPMHPDWARPVRDQCQEAGVPFFFKQWGEWAPGSEVAGKGPITHCMTPNGVVSEFYREKMIEADRDCLSWEGLRRLGKKAAGRLLDGREWNEYPEAKS